MIAHDLELMKGSCMKHTGKLLCALTLATLASSSAWAATSGAPQEAIKNPDGEQQIDICIPSQLNRVHRFGKMWANFTNSGWVGNVTDGADTDPCLDGVWAPQMEYPGGTGQQYLFVGAIWVGALIVDDSGLETPRVSVGFEGWDGGAELFPSCGVDGEIIETSTRLNAKSCLDLSDIYDSLSVSEQDFYALFSDTLENLGVVDESPDAPDNNHISLGVEIEQVSHSWSYSYAQDFIIVDYKLTNIGSKFLKNLYVGLYMDGDVGHKDEDNHHTDDFCGFRQFAVDSVTGQRVQINAAYIADNDGREHNDLVGTNFTCPHVVGTRVLRAPNPMLTTTFNWWNSNGTADRDYGPAWEYWGQHPEVTIGGQNLTWTSVLGTPDADLHKYQLLANGEFDPDMYLIDPGNMPSPQWNPTLQDSMSWLAPGANESPNLEGDDTRYLLSWGPLGVFDYTDASGFNVFRLNPGESFTMTVAFVAGENLHDRSNPQTNITGTNTGAIDASKFVWTDFDFNAIWAQRVYDNEMYDTPIYDTDGDGWYDKGDGWGGEDVGLDGLWAPAVGDTVEYFGQIVYLPNGQPAIYNGPDEDGTEGNGLIDSTLSSEIWGGRFNEDDFLWGFLWETLGFQEMREDSFLIYAGPKFSEGNREDWYVGHFNNNGFLDKGDGIPDFQGPPPPPCPDLSIETGEDFVELVWTRNSMAESYRDPFSQVQDFEGYRIWVSNTSQDNEYSLLEQFDNINFAYFDGDNALRTQPDFGPLESLPMRETNLGYERQPVGNNTGFRDIAVPMGEPQEAILLDINEDYWVSSGRGYDFQINAYNAAIAVRSLSGSYEYYLADGTQVYHEDGDQADPASGRLFSADGIIVLGERFLDESDNAGEYNNVWDKGDYDVEFRYRVRDVHSLFPRYYSVSAYDFGDYQTGTEPLETAMSCNAIRQAPSGVPGRKVAVVPNPYRADANYEAYAYNFGNSEQGLQWENQDDGTRDWYDQQDRRIEFINLPEQAVIRIYTVAGDLVQILPHNLEGDRSRWQALYSEHWDLNTRNFQQAASGLYVFSVEDWTSGSAGSISTGKFVIIK